MFGSDENAALIAMALRSVISALRRRLREQGEIGELTPAQASAWARLEQNGPMTVSALARLEGVRSQSMGETVAVLQGAGLVERVPDPADRRQILLHCTRDGLQRVAAGRTARQDWLTRKISRELDDSEQERLAAAIELLRRIAND